MNGRTKTVVNVGSGVMATLLTVGVIAVFTMSLSSNAGQAEHKTDREAHNIDIIVKSVGKIADDVGLMRIAQERQALTMENMADDIAELKEDR